MFFLSKPESESLNYCTKEHVGVSVLLGICVTVRYWYIVNSN